MGLPFVSIVGTTECDAHCEFCDRWREPIITMDPELTCRLIEQLPDQRTAIDITGGQPGLWNGISLVLNQCRKKHLPTTVTVSGPTAMNLIEDIPLISYLRVSVHGTPEHHDRFQGNGFYQANLEFLQAVMKHKQPHRPPELIFTVRKEQTAEDFWTVDQIARQLGVRVIGNFDWGLKISPKIFQLVDTNIDYYIVCA